MLVSSGIVSVAVDPTTEKVLLILAALLVGSSIGLIGALLFGFVAAGRARPARAPAVRMQAPAVTHAAPQPLADASPSAPVPGAFVAPGIGSVPALFALDSEVVRDRHRELYHAEYAKQLDHVDTLRRTIGTRMAVGGELHTPSEEPDA
jgi:hypothetical protein